MVRPASRSGNGTNSLTTMLRGMAPDASTGAEPEAKRARVSQGSTAGEVMARVFVIAAAGGLALLAVGGVVYLGAFPPTPVSHSVQKVLPNDSFRAP